MGSRRGAGYISPKNAIWARVLFSVLYTALALACLRDWDDPSPWRRLDWFSGGFLGIVSVATVYDLMFGLGRKVFRSREAILEAAGMAFDASAIPLKTLLLASDGFVFLDYGHWRLVPMLEVRAMQAGGLVLEGAAVAWLMWVGGRLARHFATEPLRRTVIRDGPFQYVRHPRYAGALAARIAFALTFASVMGWLLAPVWLLFVLRRIRHEERHLAGVFGGEYEAYARRTPRLVPRLWVIAQTVSQNFYLRKAYHVVGGILVALGVLLVDKLWFVASAAAYAVAFRVFGKRTAFGVMGVLALLVVTNSRLSALSGTAIWVIGDGLSAVIGSRFRSIMWPWPGQKSVLGTVAFAMGATLTMAIVLHAYGVRDVLPLIALAAIPSIVGCVVESLPVIAVAGERINDNFPTIMGSGLAFHALSHGLGLTLRL